jgi:hypothetical protein
MIEIVSNRLQLVNREHIHGVISGVDFGYNLSCLVRSPVAVLLWSSGTAYTSGQETHYGASSVDGVTWTPETMPSVQEWSGVVYGGGRFVAVTIDGSGVMAVSPG